MCGFVREIAGGVFVVLLVSVVTTTAGQLPDRAVLVVAKEGAPYGSIQEAIDAAPVGATIRVEPGTYEESLHVSKAVVLEGAGWEETAIAAPASAGLETLAEDLRELEQQSRAAATEEEKGRLR